LLPGNAIYVPHSNEFLVKNRRMRYKAKHNVVAMEMAICSLYLVTQRMPLLLLETEAKAIAHHVGRYVGGTIVKIRRPHAI
jgi:hypothetical protein